MRKKVFAIILTLCMVLTMMPAVAWAEGEDVEIWYDYGIEDGETMLPHNGRGIGNILYGERRTAGNNEGRDFNITSVVSDKPDVVRVTPWPDGEGYDIDAVSLGTATITITHSGFDGQVVKNILVEVVAEKWFCEWWAENDCTTMLSASSLTLTANVWYSQYDSQKDYVENVDKPYIVEWSLGDASQNDIITLAPEDNKVTVTSSSNIEGSVRVPVNMDVYCVDDNGAKVGNPVAGATVDCWVEQEYYTLELEGFNSALQKGETMTLTPSLVRHFIGGDGNPAEETVSGASFDFSACNNLDISVNDESGTISVTRPNGGNADFWLAAFLNNEWQCDRGFFLDYIDDGNQGEGGEEENGDETNRQRNWTLGIPLEGGYEPVAPNPIWSEVPTYFMHDNKDSYENFYVMRKISADREGNIINQPELLIYDQPFESIKKGESNGYWVWKINPTGDQVNKQVFDHIKLYVETEVGLQNGSRAADIWVLGTNYRNSYNNYYTEGNIALSLNLPAVGEYNDPDGFFARLSWGDEKNIFYTDMSQPADDDRNSFYVFHEVGTELRIDATKLYSFDFGGTSLSGNTGGAFEKILDTPTILNTEEVEGKFWFADPRDGKIVTYIATKVSLKKYIGYENIRLSFAAVDNSSGNDNPPVGEARVEIRNGTTIKIEGDTEGVEALRDAHNILNEALGFPPVTANFNLQDGEAYFDKAHATFSEDGQGLVCAFDIDLKPGYVIDSITDQNGKSYKFIVKYTYYYDVFDKNGQRLSTLDEMNEVGWWEAIGSGYDGLQREACMAHQEVAVSGFNVSYLDETVTSFKEFLDGTLQEMPSEGAARAPYKAKRIGAYVDYTILFGETQSTVPHSIVFHVSRPKDFRGSKVDIHGNNNIKIDINEVINFDTATGNENLAQLCEDGWEIEKVYEIRATDGEGGSNTVTNADGLVNVTISETELSGNPEDYTVVYFTEEGVPMEMPTTYVEGQGIVFTTGHFSKYAVVKKTGTTDPDPTPDPNPGTSGGGLPTTPTDNVTQTGDTTTADMTGSTVSKGGETTTTVDQSTADKLVEKATANKSEEIVISAVTKNQSAAASIKSAEVTLPAETLSAIAEKTDADVVIKTDVAEVKLDNQAAEAIASQAQASAATTGKAETVSIIAEKVKEEAEEVSFELKVVTSSGKVISDFNGGSVSVTVNVPKSLSNKKLVCVYIDENGLKHKVDGQLNADGTYTFTTGHFSTYAIMSEEDAEKAIAEQKAAVKAAKFKLRSQIVKTKSGKKAIRITWTNPTDIRFEGVEIYRSTKKSSGYGRKPIFVSKSGKYTNTSVKVGKKYYYKVRGFVTIDGEKVYTDWSYKAYRKVK